MKAILWDDFARGSDPLKRAEEDKNFKELKQQLHPQVTLCAFENENEFLTVAKKGGYDFAVVDCFLKDKPIGFDIVKEIRKYSKSLGDPELPVFLLSNQIDEVPHQIVSDLEVTPIKKGSPPSVAFCIEQRLKPLGRWTTPGTLFLIHRQRMTTHTNQPYPSELITDIRRCASESDFSVLEVDRGLNNREIIHSIQEKMLSAEKVIAILTRDELFSGKTDNFMCLPNIYLEVGMLLPEPYMQRKTFIALQNGVEFPTNLGGRPPHPINDRLSTEDKQAITRFLSSN